MCYSIIFFLGVYLNEYKMCNSGKEEYDLELHKYVYLTLGYYAQKVRTHIWRQARRGGEHQSEAKNRVYIVLAQWVIVCFRVSKGVNRIR